MYVTPSVEEISGFSKVFKERRNSFLSCIIYLVQVKVGHSVQSGGARLAQQGDVAPWLAVCLYVTSRSVVERQHCSSQQTVLTVCHSVTSQAEHSLSWEIYTSINCLRHPCQHTDCLPVHSWWEATSHTLQRWKIIPSTGVSPATLLSPPVCHNSQRP